MNTNTEQNIKTSAELNTKSGTQSKVKKDVFLKVRISLEEKNIIQEKAEECGLSISDFIRQNTLQYRLRNNSQQKEAIRHIARLSSNLNQIARQVNTYKGAIHKLQLLTCLLEIESELKEVRQCI